MGARRSPIQLSNSQRSAARIRGLGLASFHLRSREKSEGARDAGAPVDPRAFSPRGVKAIRMVVAASPLKPSASRARCLRLAP